MQEKEAQMLSEKQAQLPQQGLQQAGNMQAGKPKQVEAKKATPKELQQAEVSAVSTRKLEEKTTLFEQSSQEKLVVHPTLPLEEANVKRGAGTMGRVGGLSPSVTTAL